MHSIRTLLLFLVLLGLSACAKYESARLFDNNCSGNGLSSPEYCASYRAGR